MTIEKQEILDRLRNINEYDFERFISDLWEYQGWETSVSQASNDRGIDVIAEKDSPTPQRQLIQAKRYGHKNSVGVREIREYSSLYKRENVDTVIVVTTSSFTSQAKKEAKELNVKLIDGENLYKIIKDNSAEHLLKEYTIDDNSIDLPNGIYQERSCPNCDEIAQINRDKKASGKYEWKCNYCGEKGVMSVGDKWNQNKSVESKTSEEDQPERIEIPHNIYYNNNWKKTKYATVFSIIILYGFKIYHFPIKTDPAIIRYIILAGLFISPILFAVYASRDKRQLKTSTEESYSAHPVHIFIFIILTLGLYIPYYVIQRSGRYTSNNDKEDMDNTQKSAEDANRTP